MNPAKSDRNQKIYAMRMDRYKLREIAAVYGISKERVRQILQQEERQHKAQVG
jgi:DNA-directed RNA polymerase sigma subunit (sigma70/sigma32)